MLSPNTRIWILVGASTLLFVGLEARMIDLQIFRHQYYTAVADSQRRRASELAPRRGTIYVSEGNTPGNTDIFPIASNQNAWIAFAVPRDVEDPEYVSKELAPALVEFRHRQKRRVTDIVSESGQELNVPENEQNQPDEEGQEPTPEDELRNLQEELLAKLSKKTDPYEPLLRSYEVLDEELLSFLEEKDLSGIVLEEQEIRAYPENTLAAHVLGYVGYEEGKGRVGRYGIEGQWQKQLAGSLGFLESERDTSGQYIGVGRRQFTPAQNGDDLVLTIDRVVQSFIEEELRKGVEKYGAERGSIVVMNPDTGAVLGMATFPTFDPNFYYAIKDARVQLNPVVSDIFEPGSILKPVVMAAAIEEGLITPDTTMVDSGPVKVADRIINTFDGKHLGVQTMTQILEQSNNVGMVWVGQKLQSETMYDYFRRFGLGEKTGIELQGETQTNLPAPQEWNITTLATSSFGQGVALTPIQALNAINAIANGGRLMQPHIVSEIRSEDGNTETTDPVVVREVVSGATAEQLSAMMVSVIENGVAGLARVPGYYLAGKTGTAQVPDERGKYSPDRKIISFVGFGPVENPRFSILIKLDNPAGLSFASGTAAPMFRNISEKILQYYQVPPSYDPKQKTKQSPYGTAG